MSHAEALNKIKLIAIALASEVDDMMTDPNNCQVAIPVVWAGIQAIMRECEQARISDNPWFASKNTDGDWVVKRAEASPDDAIFPRGQWMNGWSTEMLARNEAAARNGQPLPFVPTHDGLSASPEAKPK